MNAYLRVFLYYGLPTTIITSIMLGLATNDLWGYAFGAGVGGVICIAVTIIGGVAMDNTKPATVTQGMHRGIQKINARSIIRFCIMLTPFLIIFTGALITKITMQIYTVFPVTLVTSLLSILLLVKFIEKEKATETEEKLSFFILFFTSIIPFTMTYFMFLGILFSADIESIRNLF